MLKQFFSYVASLLLGVAFLCYLSPIIIYWFVHGDQQRYQWIVNGPAPFDQLGSGAFQLWLSIGLWICATFCLAISTNITRIIDKVYEETHPLTEANKRNYEGVN